MSADQAEKSVVQAATINAENLWFPPVVLNMCSDHEATAKLLGLSFESYNVSFVVRIERQGHRGKELLRWIDPYTGIERSAVTHRDHYLVSVSNRGHVLLDLSNPSLRMPPHLVYFRNEMDKMEVGQSALLLVRDCETDVLFIEEPVTFVFGRRRVELNAKGSRRVLIKSVARSSDRSWGYLPEIQIGGERPDYYDIFSSRMFVTDVPLDNSLNKARLPFGDKIKFGVPLDFDQLD